MCARIPLGVCFQTNLVALAKARPAQMIFITTSILLYCYMYVGVVEQFVILWYVFGEWKIMFHVGVGAGRKM